MMGYEHYEEKSDVVVDNRQLDVQRGRWHYHIRIRKGIVG